jgi:hypothetical protein
MTRLRMLYWRLEVQALRHGLWIVPALLMLLGALLLWLWWLPAQQRALREAQVVRPLALAAPARMDAPALPPAALAPQAVQRLFALAAENGLQVAQAEYRRSDTGRVGRWQVQLPAQGSYPQLRRFLRAAQTIPGLSIDEMGLHRAGADGVEARLLFSLWFTVDPVEAH